jgi:uncharacterized protein (PEP-CTERM system associated)
MVRTAIVLLPGMSTAEALASDWKSTLSLTGRATLTDNVDLAPSGQQEADLYFTVTPSISAIREGARLRASFNYSPSLTAYASDTSAQWTNALSATGNLEAVKDFFFVDASAVVSQTFLSPFGALPADVGLQTGNRTETYGLSVSPYIKGTFGSQGTYEVRNRVAYTDNDVSAASSSTYVYWLARASSPFARRWNWTLEATHSLTSTSDRPDQTSSIGRAILTYEVHPDLSVNLRAGYETNDYGLTDQTNAIYGLGMNWAPTPRTNINGYVEDRFFGTGYRLSATHRRRLSSISIYGSRDVSTYPQQLLFTLPPGDARTLMDAALTARIPDPAQRQAAVEQLLTSTGTPATLFVPTTFYFEQNNLVENVGGSVALLGVRNTVVLAANWQSNQPVSRVSGQLLPPQLTGLNRYNTYGASVTWSRRLTGRTSSSFLVSRYYTEQLDNEDANSTNSLARLQLTTQFTPKTTGSVGIRWSIFDSELGALSSYTEHAVFATVSHTF